MSNRVYKVRQPEWSFEEKLAILENYGRITMRDDGSRWDASLLNGAHQVSVAGVSLGINGVPSMLIDKLRILVYRVVMEIEGE